MIGFANMIGGPWFATWSPARMFLAGQVGALYDPLDLYQDSAVPPVTPATAVGEPIGTIVSQVSGGFNWRQATAGNKMTLGNIPRGGVRNRLIRTQDFSAAAWNKFSSITVTANSVTAPDGTLTADTLLATTADSVVTQDVAVVASTTNTWSVYLRADAPTTLTIFIFTTGFVTLGSLVCNVTTAWQRFSVSAGSGANTTLRVSIGGGSTFSSPESVYAWGAQLETAASVSAYQAVDAAYQVTESGVPTLQMPYFDGNDYAVLSVNGTGVQELSSTADFFADTGKAWAVGGAFSGFTASGFLFAKGGATAGNRMLTVAVDVLGQISVNARGTTTVPVVASFLDGVLHTWLLVFNGTTLVIYIDGRAPITIAVGAAAEEAEQILMGARTSGGPATFFVGFQTITALLGYAPSATQIAQYMQQQKSYYGSP